MNLKRIRYQVSYVVDADNPEMVQHAREAIFEDVIQASLKDPEGFDHHLDILTEENLTVEDIEDFLTEWTDSDDEEV